MIAKKAAKATKTRKTASTNGQVSNWRETLRHRLSKVAGIDGIFVVETKGLVHVFTVIAEHNSGIYDPLMKQESLVEKDHPKVAFDFHTREHQGRPPHEAVPRGAEVLFLKK